LAGQSVVAGEYFHGTTAMHHPWAVVWGTLPGRDRCIQSDALSSPVSTRSEIYHGKSAVDLMTEIDRRFNQTVVNFVLIYCYISWNR